MANIKKTTGKKAAPKKPTARTAKAKTTAAKKPAAMTASKTAKPAPGKPIAKAAPRKVAPAKRALGKGLDALFVSLMSKRSDDIIRFITRHFKHRNVISGQYFLDDWHSKTYRFWRFLTLRLVFWEGFVTESTAVRVEGHA